MESQDSDARPTDVAPGFNKVEPPKTEPQPPDTKQNLPPQKPRRKWLIFILALALVITAGGVGFWRITHKKPIATPLTKVSVQLQWVNNPEFAGMYVAKDLGYYREAGLDVDLRELGEGVDTTQVVSSGEADFGIGTPLETLLGRDKGQKTKALAAIYQTSPYAIASPKSANIKTPSDFSGKTLGNSGDNNQAKVTYAALIANAGLAADQIKIKTVDFDIVKVFSQGQADTFDVYRTDQIYLLDQAKIPYNQIFPEDYGLNIYGDILIASDTKIAQNPKQVRAFTKATLKGWQYAIDHNSDTLAILAKHANELYKDPSYQKFDFNNTIPLIRATNNKPIGSMNYVPWNRAYNAIRAAELFKTEFDVSDAYTTEFLK